MSIVYSPSAVLNLFNNALVVTETKKIVQIKGVYLPGKGVNYNGYFYDQIKDEGSDACLTLVVPALIRNRMSPNKTIEFNGYITRKVINNGGRIELQITITELLNQTANKYTEDEIKALEILQKKAVTGYKDVDGYIKTCIIKGTAPEIIIIIGRTGIIDEDIKDQMAEAIAHYPIRFERISLTSEAEIIAAIKRNDVDETKIIVISRGGGENLQIFENTKIAEQCIDLKGYLITAIGHKTDSTLIQKIADKSFITPTALGQYLNDLYNETIAELQKSKAKLVEDITKTLKANFEKQVNNLQEQIKSIQTVNTQHVENLRKGHDEAIKAVKDQLSSTTTQFQQQLREKDSLLQNSRDLTNTYKSEIDRLKNELKTKKETPETNYSWLIIVGIVILVIVLARTCN